MRTVMVLCPTYRASVYEWERVQREYPDMWTHSSKNSLSLTHINGTKYIFNVDTPSELRGFRGDVIYVDEFVGEDLITNN